jgi:CheY-like chemotaxis protein
LCDLLDGFGFESVPAGSGDEALAVLREQAVELVVTDQFMPGMDGWALLRIVRRDCPGVPVLLYSSMPPRARDDELAFDDALLKPASGKQLLERIDQLLATPGAGWGERSEPQQTQSG